MGKTTLVAALLEERAETSACVMQMVAGMLQEQPSLSLLAGTPPPGQLAAFEVQSQQRMQSLEAAVKELQQQVTQHAQQKDAAAVELQQQATQHAQEKEAAEAVARLQQQQQQQQQKSAWQQQQQQHEGFVVGLQQQQQAIVAELQQSLEQAREDTVDARLAQAEALTNQAQKREANAVADFKAFKLHFTNKTALHQVSS